LDSSIRWAFNLIFSPTDRNNPTDDKTTTDISYRYFLSIGVLFRLGGFGILVI